MRVYTNIGGGNGGSSGSGDRDHDGRHLNVYKQTGDQHELKPHVYKPFRILFVTARTHIQTVSF